MEIARINGYTSNTVDKLIRKQNYRKTIQGSSTFQAENNKSKIITIPFEPKLTKGIDNILKRNGYTVIYEPAQKLNSILENPKDKVDMLEKSGIYAVSCKDCNKSYVGQNQRSIHTRFKEHTAHLKYGRIEKSSVAQHVFECYNSIDIGNLSLLGNITYN